MLHDSGTTLRKEAGGGGGMAASQTGLRFGWKLREESGFNITWFQ